MRISKKHRVFFFVLMCLIATSVWSTPILQIDNSNQLTFSGTLDLLRDSESALTINQVISRTEQFTEIEGFPALGYTSETYWFKANIHRTPDMPKEWVLKINPAYLDNVNLWQYTNGNLSQVKKLGRRSPILHAYKIPQPLQTIINVPAGDSSLYFQLQTGTTSTLIAHLIQPDVFLVQEYRSGIYKGIFVGIIILAVLFNILSGLITRVTLPLYFAAYLGFGLISFMDGGGIITHYFHQTWSLTEWRPLGFFAGLTWVFAYILFIQQFEIRKRYPILFRFCQVLVIFCCVVSLAALLGGYWYNYALRAVGPYIIFVTILCLKPALYFVRYGTSISERFVGVSFILYAWFSTLNIVTTQGWLPSNLHYILSSAYGAALQMIVLQLAIVFRVRDLMLAHRVAVGEVVKERGIREEQAQFLSMINHEIRTPLSVIDMATQSIRILDKQPNDDRDLRYSRIQSAVRRMTTLLELGKKKSNEDDELWSANEGLVDIVALTQKIKNELSTDDQLRLRINNKVTSILVPGNTSALKLTFFNLIENALKYSESHLPVTITVIQKNNALQWQIYDLGQGVAPSQVDKIFDKFYRAGDISGKSGLGLGLYISRMIILRHKGSLNCRQDIDNGACFVCLLPIK